MTDDFIKLAAVRRVATRAGALKFNKQIGTIIGADAASDDSIARSATLTKLLSIYNRMRAAKLYGQEDQFKAAQQDMSDAIADYSQKSPGGADRIKSIVQKLTFSDETSKLRAAQAKSSKAK